MNRRESYEPLDGPDDMDTGEDRRSCEDEALLGNMKAEEVPFSWLEYIIFCLLGVSMLWAWNMFLAAAPYFAARFAADAWIAANFQSAILAVSTVTNLATVLVLSRIQASASYPFRIGLALALNTLVFAALTLSTAAAAGRDAPPAHYFAFLLLMVGAASYASGLLQNGGYAFVAGFGRPEYMQAIIAGQGVAGVLPAVAQVVSVVLYAPGPRDDASSDSSKDGRDGGGGGGGSTSAFAYFMAAVVMSAITLLAMLPLVRRHRAIAARRLCADGADADPARRPAIPLARLLSKLRWLAAGVVVLFTSTMFFPIFTAKIPSVDPSRGVLFQPFAFIPLGFFCWNLGDLTGRVLSALPPASSSSSPSSSSASSSGGFMTRPPALFALSVLRIAQLPLYLLCNVGGRGAAVPSDAFYLGAVQFGFGLTNGWLFSSIMVASGDCVDGEEREATGGFMGLCLVAGLAAGSLLSFTASGI